MVSDVPESNGNRLRRVWPEVGEPINEAGVVCDDGEIAWDGLPIVCQSISVSCAKVVAVSKAACAASRFPAFSVPISLAVLDPRSSVAGDCSSRVPVFQVVTFTLDGHAVGGRDQQGSWGVRKEENLLG